MMECFKKLYGRTIIDKKDSDEIQDEEKIELEYYQLENSTSDKPYGVEIVKRRMENNIVNIEDKIIYHICNKRQDADLLLKMLVSNKVTPISVEDIVQDFTKIRAIWEYSNRFLY